MKIQNRFKVWSLACALALVLAPQGGASVITLTSGTSVLKLDPTNSSGVSSWTINGVPVLAEHWFWYRLGSSGDEQSLSTLPHTVTQPAPNQVKIKYWDGTNNFHVFVTLTLLSFDAFSADLSEVIGIVNESSKSNLDFHFFQYADFDLDLPTGPGETVTISQASSGALTAHQVGAKGSISETTSGSGGATTHYEAGTYPTPRNKFGDGSPTTLANIANAGPGDVAWAFQWDKVIGPELSLTFSKDLFVRVVPEPAAILLFGAALLFAGGKLRRRLIEA